MKYLLIFFYIGQVCAPSGSPAGGPPYFYMRAFNTYEEARKEELKLEEFGDGHGVVVYGNPDFGKMLDKKG